MKKILTVSLLVLIFSSAAFANYTVYLRNGATREVKYVEFKDNLVDLYLTTGIVMSVSVDEIDYSSTGIRPGTRFGEKVFAPGEQESKSAAPKSDAPKRVFTNQDVPHHKDTDSGASSKESEPVVSEGETKPEGTKTPPILEKIKSKPKYIGIVIGIIVLGVVIAIGRSKSSGGMFWPVLLIVVVGGGAFGVFKGIDLYYIEDATSRVETILTGMKSTSETDMGFQTAVFTWATGRAYEDDQWTLTTYLREFQAWRAEMGITKVENFEIKEAVVEKGASPPTVIVSVMIDGQPYKMRVPKSQKISWVQ